MDVLDIIKKYLKENGYDGLCFEECCCGINDLMPCNAGCDQCEPGYKVPCHGDEGGWCDGECEWYISPTKEKL